MRSSNRPTKHLSSAPELLSVLGSTVTPKSSSVSFVRETMRGIAAQQLRHSLVSGCVVLALEPPNKEVLPETEGTNVRDEKENLAVWGSRRYWDAITQKELLAELA